MFIKLKQRILFSIQNSPFFLNIARFLKIFTSILKKLKSSLSIILIKISIKILQLQTQMYTLTGGLMLGSMG